MIGRKFEKLVMDRKKEERVGPLSPLFPPSLISFGFHPSTLTIANLKLVTSSGRTLPLTVERDSLNPSSEVTQHLQSEKALSNKMKQTPAVKVVPRNLHTIPDDVSALSVKEIREWAMIRQNGNGNELLDSNSRAR